MLTPFPLEKLLGDVHIPVVMVRFMKDALSPHGIYNPWMFPNFGISVPISLFFFRVIFFIFKLTDYKEKTIYNKNKDLKALEIP
jgi:hypothetical protein